jgi:26S proteasome regulatory subunit N1
MASKDAPKKDEKKDKIPKLGETQELSDEDKELKEKLDLLVERLQDGDPKIRQAALEGIREEVQTATSSMTSVPKPLKFLIDHYQTIRGEHGKTRDEAFEKDLADLISVLAITSSEEKSFDSLNFVMKGTRENLA